MRAGAAAASLAAIAGIAAAAAAPATAATSPVLSGSASAPAHAAALAHLSPALSGVSQREPLAGLRPATAPTASAPTASAPTAAATRIAVPGVPAVARQPASPAPSATQAQPAAPQAATPAATPVAKTASAAKAPAAQVVRGQQAKTTQPKHVASVPAVKSARHQVSQPAPGPYSFYDSVTPGSIPAHKKVATYATGGYAVSASAVAGRGPVLWIDTNGSDPHAAVLDVEPGDATPSMAASWASSKLHSQPGSLACIYTMQSEWPAVKAAIHTLSPAMQKHVRYWIADPTGYAHILPGATATQWYWGHSFDISLAKGKL